MAQPTTTFAKVAEKLKDLPVNAVAADVVQTVKEGKVTILTAETGSGKTLLANAELADHTDDQVVVLVPRRFLAMNAAEAIAELGELELGKEVGFAIGSQGKDESKFSPDTKLLFATYGYAISSGLIDTAKTVVADEVHEAGADTSLARAILHRRLQSDPDLRVVEMSATLDAEKQASYWRDITDVAMHHAEGRAFDCEQRYVHPSESDGLHNYIVNLLINEDRNGIAVFRPGVGEVESTAEKVRTQLDQMGRSDIEVAYIYGDMSAEERAEALAPPKNGTKKVLVGTNVIESGMNIPWLDTGVSDGKGRIPYYRDNGAEALLLEDLPQWRLVQQEGRVKRFTEGLYVLIAEFDRDDRVLQQPPEVERISLNGLCLAAASYGIDPTELKFDGKVRMDRLAEAHEDLKRLGLITDGWNLTDKGEFVRRLPLGPEAGSLVYEAPAETRDYAIQLAAVLDMGGLRADYKEGHGRDDTSDVFDGLKAFRDLGWEATEEECEASNVSWRKYKLTCDLVEDIHQRLGVGEAEQRKATFAERQKLMLHAGVNRLFKVGDPYLDLIRGTREHEEGRATNTSHNEYPFAVAYPREIQTRNGPITIVQNITKIPRDVFIEFVLENEQALENLHVRNGANNQLSIQGNYFGQTPVTISVGDSPSEHLQALLERAQRNQTPQKSNAKGVKAEEGKDDLCWPPKGVKPIERKPSGLRNTSVEELTSGRDQGLEVA